MLHEILLSLSGHPSPLLRTDAPELHALAAVSPAERQLLASTAHLSSVHVKLISYTAQIANSHPSTICRAAATAIDSIHLAAFQRKVLEVEDTILQDDPELVGAYNIVPLTAVVGEFQEWTRRMEWLWEMVQFMLVKNKEGDVCHGARLMDRLRTELQSGYQDVVETAMSLVTIAETAWLKQVSAWILYGRLPNFGSEDFFVQRAEESDEEYVSHSNLLPSFVTPATASSMLFIGKSLNHIRVRSSVDSGLQGLDHLSSKLQELANLTFPLNNAEFSRAIIAIRISLSENTLQKLLPLARVEEMLQLLRDFFLLGRGEFAMALTHEADDKIRSRWRRADNLAHEKGEGLKNITIKEGEVAAVLGRTWAVLASMQGQHAEEDEQLELARDLLRLNLTKTKTATPIGAGSGLSEDAANILATSPFRNLLFSVPSLLSSQIPQPLDMVLSPSDLQLYSCINAYLLSMRRAHIRLTDLWKITSLRRHHPAPRGGREQIVLLRERWTARSMSMRSSWTTASATIFFLAETEAYLQTEIVAGLWEGFHTWLTPPQVGQDTRSGATTPAPRPSKEGGEGDGDDDDEEEEEDLWLQEDDKYVSVQDIPKTPNANPSHDPQTLSTAHRLYLRTLIHRLLLTKPSFTQPLYSLLIHIDHLVAHLHRLHAIYTSLDLEEDAGVVDAFVDLEAEERDVKRLLVAVENRVRAGIEDVVAALRSLEADPAFAAEWEGDAALALAEHIPGTDDDAAAERGGYVPARVGGINRLLMKLDFGTWFGRPDDEGDGEM
ncbi:gamma-tubulin complex component protein [Dactylonectria macrodidyma]|uniref:Spindle pole body component n=1 Tax=Dactylonectria macrodidyma TaxID=307937 RepID=A0A9P9ESL3_9HYPO|nr:gamma-tubulin complex component protein [Dactylonectria macrodidyma]